MRWESLNTVEQLYVFNYSVLQMAKKLANKATQTLLTVIDTF